MIELCILTRLSWSAEVQHQKFSKSSVQGSASTPTERKFREFLLAYSTAEDLAPDPPPNILSKKMEKINRRGKVGGQTYKTGKVQWHSGEKSVFYYSAHIWELDKISCDCIFQDWASLPNEVAWELTWAGHRRSCFASSPQLEGRSALLRFQVAVREVLFVSLFVSFVIQERGNDRYFVAWKIATMTSEICLAENIGRRDSGNRCCNWDPRCQLSGTSPGLRWKGVLMPICCYYFSPSVLPSAAIRLVTGGFCQKIIRDQKLRRR